MAVAKNVKNEAEAKAQHAAANPWVERLARFGYAVRGILYAVVGLLAVQVALGAGGATTDKHGAIATISRQPFGEVLLVLIVIGLTGYSLWGFIRAILDPLGRGTDPKGIAQRIGYLISGVSYGALVIPTVRFIMGAGGEENSNASVDMTATLLSQPFGQWLAGVVGVIGMIGGLGQMYQAYSTDFKKDFKSSEMSPNEMKLATWVGRIGMAARGVVFVMLGFFVLQAGLQANPQQAKGLDGALATLAQQSFGPWILGAVALGLVAFGAYSVLCARWIRVTPGDKAK
jgi:hypothetical protein